ncbi:MAG TPA: mucoidy inhibitor MuiA family protein, partial [Streptosporangiaceae bacterium]|nr:mucoidy inhibitor MuiA family protein [Streptosporangiaceae bacterium]
MAEAIDLDAPITAVTVFRDGARVVRTGTLTLDAGTRQVTIAGLPAAADPASVRVAVRGHHLGLLDVEVHKRFAADPKRQDVVRLRNEAEERRDEVQALDDADAAEQASLTFAGHLSEAAATALARAVSFGRISRDELDQMSSHLAEATSAALGRRREIAARRRVAHREMQAAEQRLADSEKRPRPAQYTDVSATLEVTAGTEAEVELSYHVSGVSWRPLYDLGLTGEKLTVNYLAEITQRTGEDWPAVPLVASTTRQGQHQSLPELTPWYVGRQRVTPYPPMAAGFAAQTLSSYDASATQPGGPVPAPARARSLAAPEAEPIVAEVSEAGAALAYQVQRPLVIPSDGSPHKTTIARFDLDAVLDHLAVPVLALEAYLRATVTNGSKLLLLPGPARVFHDGQFVGETTLETVAAGEEFELQLGV